MTRRTESQKEELLRVRDFVSRLGFAASDRDGDGAITRRLYNEHAAEKYQAMLIPRDHGGRGDDYLTAGIIYEELSYYGIGFMPALLTTVHCAELIKIAATEKQRDVYLDAIADGKKVFGFCLTEEAAGSDISGITCEARESDDSYIISGEKSVVINSAIADYFIVIASTNPAAGRAALNAFVVDASLPGVDCDNSRFDFGFNQSVIGSVRFRDVHIPKENILGENEGNFLVMGPTRARRRGVYRRRPEVSTSRRLYEGEVPVRKAFLVSGRLVQACRYRHTDTGSEGVSESPFAYRRRSRI